MSSISTEQLFANTIASNASIQAHLEIILKNQAEILSKMTGEEEQVLLSAFQFDVNNRTKQIKSEMLAKLADKKSNEFIYGKD
ncbi:hypothetical protein Fleli_0181 [Bernardetia litoralis DSM 6794]|uniref:Uncharacterized protein n=1 Tax=Bernardetia litoralis (strain ATCC 23117 / DSM 6794 / NBRC 15988 / NCIMB 1366 / Fx l1 / Sio-4) TaxID=880071 RepID=I4AFE4_BERLS|nr:hypothetical protein [Bernardetia litoralis]AFM02679.1 hypothetical protein Fleli_0181 [Bernardetia litoralis DSM 6794]